VSLLDDIRPELTDEAFRLVRDLVYEASGIALRDELRFVVQRRLVPRLEALGLPDFTAYYRFLRFSRGGREELEAAIDAVSTHETYFFREPTQLAAFSAELLPLLARRNARVRALRLWSAGCSTGEEAFTLAMLVQDSGLFAGWDVEVFGTDISRRVLATARRAEFGESSLRATGAAQRARFFEPVGAGRVRVREEVRARVTFGHLNLLEPHAAALLPRMDAVFCRNVLLYLDLPARRRVLQLLYDRLVECGILLLGHAENLLSISSEFELVHLARDLVYRRPASAGEGA
jgi:chemotaxis protein methyltransferase CheR